MIWGILSKIGRIIHSFFTRKYNIVLVEDEPEKIKSKTIYVIGDDDFQAIAIMLCPCGCNSKIHLNLLPGNKPTWSVSTINGIPTLRPSIWRKIGCESHFFVRKGKIVWAGA